MLTVICPTTSPVESSLWHCGDTVSLALSMYHVVDVVCYVDRYVYYCMKYINNLLSFGIKPIMVFDGCRLPSKQEVEKSRREYVTSILV